MSGDQHPFYVPRDAFGSGGWIPLPEEESRHATQVLRLVSGDTCRVIDGEGGLYHVRLDLRGRSLGGVVMDTERELRRSCMVELGFPVLRVRSRTEWLLEKAVEVGAERLVPVDWSRSAKDARASTPRARWERIVVEALKQSERRWLPQLTDAEAPYEILEASGGDERVLVVLADVDGGSTLPAYAGESRIRLMVGPEGGPAPEERQRILEHGGVAWSLGAKRLRAETAAIVGIHGIDSYLRAAGV